MKSIHISDEVHKQLKIYCASKGLQINSFVEKLIKDFLKREAEE
jgi:predicted HicB family RNase H-like nuclease